MSIDNFLIQCRWASVQQKRFVQLTLDAISYRFVQPLTQNQQDALLNFLKDEPTMQSLSMLDICQFLRSNQIAFKLRPAICRKRNFSHHWKTWRLASMCTWHLNRDWDTWFAAVQAAVQGFHTEVWYGNMGICCGKPIPPEIEQQIQEQNAVIQTVKDWALLFAYFEEQQLQPRLYYRFHWSEGLRNSYLQFKAYRLLKKYMRNRQS